MQLLTFYIELGSFSVPEDPFCVLLKQAKPRRNRPIVIIIINFSKSMGKVKLKYKFIVHS